MFFFYGIKFSSESNQLNFFRRAARVFARHGIRGSIQKGYIVLVDLLYDLKYGIRTIGWATLDQLTVTGDNKSHGNRYEPLRVVILRRYFQTITPHLPEHPVLVDIGAGRGRILLVATEFSFVRAVGIEFALELVEDAKRNFERFMKRSLTATKLEIIHVDAATYQFESDQNVFLIYNPFSAQVLDTVLSHIQLSLQSSPRHILITLFNNEYGDVVEKKLGFQVIVDVRSIGYSFIVYSNLR
jgi:hypothetical protein